MSDVNARAYLLGQLPATEAAQLEERLLEDEEVFMTLKSVEDDLFDECARDALNLADRERFLERYGSQADRLTFAQALAVRNSAVRVARVGEARTPERIVSFASRRGVGLAAAAMLVLVVGAVLMRRPAVSPTTPAVSAPVAVTITPPVTVLSLTLATSRSVSGASAVALPAGASTLQLRVRLDPADRFDRYSVELRSASNRVVWSGADLRASTEGGDLVLGADLPGGSLDVGTYELAVRGGAAGATLEDLGFATLEFRRSR